jgi:hypothetical protein
MDEIQRKERPAQTDDSSRGRSHIVSIVLAFLLAGASVWVSYACTAGSPPVTDRFGAVVIVSPGVTLPPPNVSVAFFGHQSSAQLAEVRQAGYDPTLPVAAVIASVPNAMNFDVALAGVLVTSCKVSDQEGYASILSTETINSAALISYDRFISTDVMGSTPNPRKGALVHIGVRAKPTDAVTLTCSLSENPEAQTATSRTLSIDTALILGSSFATGGRPKSIQGKTLVLPETASLQAPPEATHVTYDGAVPAGEYVPEEDDATAPTDAFSLTATAPVLTAQWDDTRAITLDNLGLFIAGGLFGLAIGNLVDPANAGITKLTSTLWSKIEPRPKAAKRGQDSPTDGG